MVADYGEEDSLSSVATWAEQNYFIVTDNADNILTECEDIHTIESDEESVHTEVK